MDAIGRSGLLAAPQQPALDLRENLLEVPVERLAARDRRIAESDEPAESAAFPFQRSRETRQLSAPKSIATKDGRLPDGRLLSAKEGLVH